MGLFNNTKIQLACPNCGKEHDLVFHNVTHLYLDCSPAIPMSQFAQRIVICTECGLVYFLEDLWLLDPEGAVSQPEYQEALKAEYLNDAEKKLVLMELLYEFEFVPLYRAHLYRECNDTAKEQEWLNIAIKNIEDGVDTVVDAYTQQELHNLSFHGELYVSPEMRLIDLYRRTRQFDKAKERAESIIKSLNDSPEDAPCRAYLQRELNLIKKKNDTPQ